MFVLDMRDAMRLMKDGSLLGPTPAIQAWIDYARTSWTDADFDEKQASLWRAHQISLHDAIRSQPARDAFADEWIGKIAYGLYLMLPNLQYFNLKNEILYLQPNDPLPTDVFIMNLVAYGLVYGVAGYLIAYWIFWRKEL